MSKKNIGKRNIADLSLDSPAIQTGGPGKGQNLRQSPNTSTRKRTRFYVMRQILRRLALAITM
jgi:hypothetical protein